MKKFKHILTIFLFATFLAWNMNAMAQTYSITVIQPNGGESWAVGTSHLISWTDNLSGAVKIELLQADTVFRTITSSVTGSTYSWAIPDSTVFVGTNFKVKISSTVNNTISDVSDNVFTIISTPTGGTIHVVQPDVAGISWAVGTTHLISWTANETVKIELLQADTVFRTITSSVTGSTYSWAIPDSSVFVGTNFKIKVTSTANSAVTDTSDNAFAITSTPTGGTIRVVQPDVAGISWAVGTTHLLSWTADETVKIELLQADTVFRTITSSTTGSTYNWAIPDSAVFVGSNFKIKVTSTANSAVTDTSDNAFAIIATPTGGTIHVVQPDVAGISWAVGTTHLLSWTDNLSDSVKIELLQADTVFRTIINSTAGSTYGWAIPDSAVFVGSNFKIKVTSTANSAVTDTSDNAFAITATPTGGTIHVVQPDVAGISWVIGTTHLLSWTASEPVKIELLQADTVFRTITSSVTGTTYYWAIPDSAVFVGANFKVKISSTANSAVSDTSDNVFAITATSSGGTIHVVQPNEAGISWVIGTTKLLSWTASEPVKIELLQADTVFRTITSSVTGTTYSWAIPDSTVFVGTNFKIKITSTANSTISDTSDNAFAITATSSGGTIRVVQPNGGEIWPIGTTQLLSWTANETVKIELLQADTVFRTITSSVTGSTYSWAIPDSTVLAGTNFKIKVTSTANSAVTDTSDNVFSLIQPPRIQVYPNPSTTHVIMKFNNKVHENYILTLYNRYNIIIMTKPVNTSFTKELRINTFDLPNGIYFLRLTSARGVISKKIIVQH